MKTIIAIAGALVLAVGARAQVVEYPGLTVGLVTNIVEGMESGSPTALGLGALATTGARSKSYQTARLIEGLKADGLWNELIYLQLFGKGYQNTSNNLVVRGPRQDIPGNTFNFALNKTNGTTALVGLTTTISNCTVLACGAGANYADIGNDRYFFYLHNIGGYPWNTSLVLAKATGGNLNVQTVGNAGGSVANFSGGGGPYATYPPQTYVLTHNATNKAVILYTNAITALSNAYTHGMVNGLTHMDYAGIQFNYTALAVWNRPLTTNEVTLLENILRRTVLGANCNIITDGDSILNITADSVTTWTGFIFGGPSSDWAATANYYNACTSGHETTDVLSGLPAQALQAITNNTERTIAIIEAGTNDYGNHDSTNLPIATIEARLSAIWRSYRTNGAQPVIACTVLSRDVAANRPPNDLADLNNYIRSKEGIEYDVLCDLDRQFYSMLGPNYHTNTTYFSDGIHPNASGGAGLRVMRDAFQAIAPKVFP